ncbi:Enterobactin outer-membrane receptor [Raoultella terrigena]|uniref:Enterobactin outer-membrane receptor n=1 Tax=Raoultella terrigena TaxID=577 RepID=A0A3P8M419_RAOTE|nr:Enterobactin outer-membrane receptor [Raoultella terrigena]
MNVTLDKKRPIALFWPACSAHPFWRKKPRRNWLTMKTMLVTAEQGLKQQPGVSIITEEDIQKSPPVNDLADIIRKMPGREPDRQWRQRQPR